MKTILRVSAGATVLIVIWVINAGSNTPRLLSDLHYWFALGLNILFFFLLIYLSHVEDL